MCVWRDVCVCVEGGGECVCRETGRSLCVCCVWRDDMNSYACREERRMFECRSIFLSLISSLTLFFLPSIVYLFIYYFLPICPSFPLPFPSFLFPSSPSLPLNFHLHSSPLPSQGATTDWQNSQHVSTQSSPILNSSLSLSFVNP